MRGGGRSRGVLRRILENGLISPFNGYGQGIVWFGNEVAFHTVTDDSRLVYKDEIAAENELVGTQFRAQLYYGADASSLTPVATTGNTFRASGTHFPGTWANPGSRVLVGFTEGNT